MILTLEGLQVIALLCQPNVAKMDNLKCQKYYAQCVKDTIEFSKIIDHSFLPPAWHRSSVGEVLQECLLNKKDE